MNISLAIILGLTGAVSWGAADFAARFASRQVGAYRTLFFMQFFGFLALCVYLKSTGGFSHGIAPGWQPWAMAVAAGLLNVLASLALYHSFEHGTLSIVGPVSSSYPALTVALSLLSGERIHAVRATGLAVTLLGVILAATSFAQSKPTTAEQDAQHASPNHASPNRAANSRAHLSTGVGWAIFAALGFGVLFWFLGFHVVPAVGSAVSVWVMRLTALVSLALAAAPAHETLRLPSGKVWWLLLAVGILDTAAFVANNAGLSTGQVSVVSVLASLYGAFTVLLAWIFLRERLERSQWLGIVLIFIGIVLVSI
ncbi:MAG: DMT family transporter [Candidatus Acidiferrales bacterium]|jgi:drug/metabolite transporter (DMT)-like permease